MRTIFITGATGYIGGTVLPTVLRVLRENNEPYQVRALVRTESKCKQLEEWAKQRGLEAITPVIGTLESKEVIVQECMQADTVISCADADDLQFAHYLTEALTYSIEQGQHPVVIHTSGTNLLTDGAGGMQSTEKVYSDDEPLEIKDTQPHRDVDLHLLNFHEQQRDKLDLAIIAPPTIWGLGRGPSGTHSVQIPRLISTAIAHKQAFNVGKGLNVWTQINVVDLARMYSLVLVNMIKTPGKHGGFYWCEGGEFEWREVGQQIHQGLVDSGFVTEPVRDTDPEDQQAFGRVFTDSLNFDYNNVIGGNARVRAVRARKELGWDPVYSSRQQFYDYITEEVALMGKQ